MLSIHRQAFDEASQNVPFLKTIQNELGAMGSSDDFSQAPELGLGLGLWIERRAKGEGHRCCI